MRRSSTVAVLNAAVLTGAVLVAASAADRSSAAPAADAAAVPVSAAPQASPTTAAPAAPAPAPVAPTAVPSPPPTTAPPTPPPVPRVVQTTGYRPYATVGGLALHFPGDRVEAVGLHESGHDGALPQSPLPDAGRIGALGSRSRGTNGQGAADVVMDPASQVRAPVTGTVVRAGTYTLYCDHVDEYLVVVPDGQPTWEVKLLHVVGLRVGEGDRVLAGRTVVADRARVLPFASQVDKHTASPAWPHVHVEVVDTAVEDRPSGRSCD